MSAAQPGLATPELTTEQKITQAVAEASQVVNHFSPTAATAIAAGAAAEPVFSAMIHLFIALFHHSMKKQAASQ